jgi:hypothetical protein
MLIRKPMGSILINSTAEGLRLVEIFELAAVTSGSFNDRIGEALEPLFPVIC